MSLRDDLGTISASVRHTTPEIRLLKIGEEYGEAVAAFIGLGGWNPRKGQHGTRRDVATELADTALSALIALEDYCIDPCQIVTLRAAHVAARAGALPEPTA